jgi:hypothetical protein
MTTAQSTAQSKETKTLTFELHNELFIGYSRKKYDQPYTTIPQTSYSPVLKDLMTALSKVLAVEEGTPLTVVSSEGYVQRVSGPRVYVNPEEQDSLIIRYDRESIPLVRTVTEDGETIFSVRNTTVTLGLIGENPTVILPLGKGRKAIIPFHTIYQEVKIPGIEMNERIEAGNYADIISPVPGVGGSLAFSALKDLATTRYKVIKTELSAGGKFGPKVKITLEAPVEMTILCSVSADGVWSKNQVIVAKGSKIVVDANTALTKSLQGLALAAKDNVYLDIFGKDVNEDDGKVYVRCAFDYSESKTLAFDFD